MTAPRGKASAPAPADLLEVGRVAKAHGLAGEVRVLLHWSESQALQGMAQLVLRKGEGPLRYCEVTAIRPGGAGFLITLKGVADRTQAEALRGSSVLVPREQLPPLQPGEYYLADLVGMRVQAPDGEVGTVVDLALYPTAECAVIETADGARWEQPLLDEWVERVDGVQRVLHLKNRDGLLG